MSKVNKIDFLYLYNHNLLIDNIVKLDFKDLVSHSYDLNIMLHHIYDIQKKENATTWTKFFLPLKKLVLTIEFFTYYLYSYNYATNNFVEENERLVSFRDDIVVLLNDISNNQDILKKLKELNKTENNKRKVILKVWLKNFFKTDLSLENKKKYDNFIIKLDKKITIFEENSSITQWGFSDATFIPLKDKFKLEGIPNEIIKIGEYNAKNLNRENKGWIFFVDDTTTYQLLVSSRNRSFRKKIYLNNKKVNNSNNSKNNDFVLKDILSIKQHIAHIYKKNNYAELVLSNYVLSDTNQAYSYLSNIEKQLLPYVENIKNKMEILSKKDNIRELKDWDILYYYNQALKDFTEKTSTDLEKEFKSYFSFDTVINKFFNFIKNNFSVELIELNRKVINKELLITYKIKDLKTNRDGYLIFSPYDNLIKNCPFQMSCLFYEKIGHSQQYLPSVNFISLNLTSSYKKEVQLDFSDLTILIHEFGHALHAFFGSPEDSKLNNSLLSWDLIELPSKYLEYLMQDYDFVKEISFNKKLKTQLPKDLFLEILSKKEVGQVYELYQEIKRYEALLWLHENFKKYSQKSPLDLINQKLKNQGIVYNIIRDDYMINNDYLCDYAPSGYVYLYADNIAYNIKNKQEFKKYDKLRYIYSDIFNFKDFKHCNKTLKDRLENITDLNTIDIISYLKKDINIKLFGE